MYKYPSRDTLTKPTQFKGAEDGAKDGWLRDDSKKDLPSDVYIMCILSIYYIPKLKGGCSGIRDYLIRCTKKSALQENNHMP